MEAEKGVLRSLKNLLPESNFVIPLFLPTKSGYTEAMFKKIITTNDVLKINDRWKKITIPDFIQERMNKNAEKLANP